MKHYVYIVYPSLPFTEASLLLIVLSLLCTDMIVDIASVFWDMYM